MKKETGITLVSLVVTIIILIILAGISINITIGEEGIITKAKQAKQNIVLSGEAEAVQLNQLYDELESSGGMTEDEESSKKDEIIAELQNQLNNLNSILSQTDATADKILLGYRAYSRGQLLTGTMKNNGTINKTLNAGESFTIPEGYTLGGRISVNGGENQKALEIQIPIHVATGAVNYAYNGQVTYIHKNGVNVQVIKTEGDDGIFGNIVIANDIFVDITNQLIEGNNYRIYVNSNAEGRHTKMILKLSFERKTGYEIEIPIQATTGATNHAYDGWLDYIHMDGIKVEVKKTGGNSNGKFGNIIVSNNEYIDITSQLVNGGRYRCRESSGNSATYANMTIKLSF
ncbi:MAG: hypothetical protein ACLS95_02825 [Clostridia bacterium]